MSDDTQKQKPVLKLAKPVQVKAAKKSAGKKRAPGPFGGHFGKGGASFDQKRRDKTKAKPKPQQGQKRDIVSLSRVDNLPANRMAAFEVAQLVLLHDHYLDKALAENERLSSLYPSDRQFVRLLVTGVLRHHAQLDTAIISLVNRKPPAEANLILMMGAAQLWLLKMQPHAAISTSVDLMRAAGFDHMTGLANAVLRKIANQDFDLLAAENLSDNIAAPLLESWQAAYGAERVARFLPVLFTPPEMDLSFAKAERAADFAKDKEAVCLLDKVVRTKLGGDITSWEGFAEGAWWVQDIAAAMPAHLLGDVADKHVIDMCAAPGGKTAQLIASGAKVTALEIDPKRARRLQDNLERLQMSCVIEVEDARQYRPDGKVDAVLLDAPCSATGTIRKRPDVMQKDISTDLKELPQLQYELARAALGWLKTDGQLIYATCSLQPEEGEQVITRLTSGDKPRARLLPFTAEEAGPFASALTNEGTLRLLPDALTTDDAHSGGNDGFFIARLQAL